MIVGKKEATKSIPETSVNTIFSDQILKTITNHMNTILFYNNVIIILTQMLQLI